MIKDQDLGVQFKELTGEELPAEKTFQKLPLYVQLLACNCNKDYRESRVSCGDSSIGMACSLCGRPSRYSLVFNWFYCEGCDKAATFDFRKPFDPKYKLCEACDVPSTVHRPKRTRIKFN